jgi:hypothetical protein
MAAINSAQNLIDAISNRRLCALRRKRDGSPGQQQDCREN